MKRFTFLLSMLTTFNVCFSQTMVSEEEKNTTNTSDSSKIQTVRIEEKELLKNGNGLRCIIGENKDTVLFTGIAVKKEDKDYSLETPYNKGVINGLMTRYYRGEIVFTCEYEDGKKNGQYISYTYNDEIESKGFYFDDEKTGNWIECMYINNITHYGMPILYITESYVKNYPMTKDVTDKIFSSEQITSDYINNNCKYITPDISNILSLDVYSSFHLKDYDTPLKKQVYEESEDYKKQLLLLKDLKNKVSNTTFYFKYRKQSSEDLGRSLGNAYLIGDYDLTKGGFTLTLNNFEGRGLAKFPAKTFRIKMGEDRDDMFIQLLPLPLTPVNGIYGDYSEKLFISVSKTVALKMEENAADVVMYFLFSPSYKVVKLDSWGDSKINLLCINKVKIIVANDETKEVYFTKTYNLN